MHSHDFVKQIDSFSGFPSKRLVDGELKISATEKMTGQTFLEHLWDQITDSKINDEIPSLRFK